jgi:tRNA pseudouridine32 synthase/23S rRNA pseudouridine746 synthase/23S rRNA pseudouridine1911/1915/1917 synthase
MPDKKKRRGKHQPRGLIILHEDRDMIVVDKSPALLTIGTDTQRVETAYYRLTDYVKKGNAKSRERVFIVHRLDREVSGILLFARSPAAKKTLQEQWDRVEKRYLALVHGAPAEPEGTFRSYLVENGVHSVHTTTDTKRGRLCETGYKVLRQDDETALLGVRLVTGRKHQIRVQLADNGLPIVGDKKYGNPRTKVRRLGLHAKSLAFKHPYNGEPCFFETRTPRFFSRTALEE